MLTVCREILLCFCHLGTSSVCFPISDREAVRRLSSAASAGMAMEMHLRVFLSIYLSVMVIGTWSVVPLTEERQKGGS